MITSTSKLFFCWRNNDFWSVFDGIKDIVVPRFVGVIVEVISQLATLSKFNDRILNHNKCLDNGGLILVNQPTNIHFRRFGMGKVRCPPKKDATGPKWPSGSLVWEWFFIDFRLIAPDVFFCFSNVWEQLLGRQRVRKEHPKILWNLCNLASWWDDSSWLVHFVFDLEVQTHTFPNNNCLLEEGNSIFKNCYFCQGSDFLF